MIQLSLDHIPFQVSISWGLTVVLQLSLAFHQFSSVGRFLYISDNFSELRDNRLPNLKLCENRLPNFWFQSFLYITFHMQFWFALCSLCWSIWFLRFRFFPLSGVTALLIVDLILSKCILSFVSSIERLIYTFEYWLWFLLIASRISFSSRYFLRSLSSILLLFL